MSSADHGSPPVLAAPEATYRARCDYFGALRDRYRHRSDRNGNVSLGLMGAALLCAGVALWANSPLLLWLAGALLLAFVVSFTLHGRVNRWLRRYSELWSLNNDGLARLRRDWAALPLRQPPAGPPRPDEPDNARLWARDLDLLGRASLQHLLGTPSTPAGLALLESWLLLPAAPEVARGRQAAVAELAPLVDLRDELALRGRLMDATQSNYEAFLRWAEGSSWLASRPWLLWLARVSAPLVIVLALALWAGQPVLLPLLAALVLNLAVTLTLGRAVDALIDEVAARQSVFRAYAELFQLVTTSAFAAPELIRLQGALSAGSLRADQQMVRIGRIMPLADLRHWMFFFPVQVATLWNVHVLWLLERWQASAGPRARGWLAALGEAEALAALAALAHDNPDWVFPELGRAALPQIRARQLAHPLLPPDRRVGNDVTIGPPGSFLLVTGSNMSGKSTLLRSIGLNSVLAQMGAPVCAASLSLPPLALATSMRVQDSLEQGVSYFMAELQRLKAVVDTARQVQAAGAATPLFLLDEILQGTNTAERQIAARQIILHLVRLGALGAVSTHDLSLADAPEMAAAQPVYFTEQFIPGPDGPQMTFDYQLRPGLATSTNALALVRQLLGDVLEADAAA